VSVTLSSNTQAATAQLSADIHVEVKRANTTIVVLCPLADDSIFFSVGNSSIPGAIQISKFWPV
jgi:hypothetical protein